MPTAGKLIAALILAATGWLCAELIKPQMEVPRELPRFAPTCAIIGALCGWFYLGRRFFRGKGDLWATTVTSCIVHIFFTVFAFAVAKMLTRSTQMAYDTVIAALSDIFALGAGYVGQYFNAEVIAVILFGNFLAAGMGLAAFRRWG